MLNDQRTVVAGLSVMLIAAGLLTDSLWLYLAGWILAILVRISSVVGRTAL